MKKLFCSLLFLVGCAPGHTSLRSDLLDSSTLQPTPPASAFNARDLRLGEVRYTRDRFRERENVAWHFSPEGEFFRGSPKSEGAGESVRVRVYEVGAVEKGKYRGYQLERWDLAVDGASGEGAGTEFSHQYFLRGRGQLVWLPTLAKGPRMLWKNAVLNYWQQRWNVRVTTDGRYVVPELLPERQVLVPGEGMYRARTTGESAALTEGRLGTLASLGELPKGRELFRVPGNFLVCVYPDGLAVPLEPK